MSQESDGMNFCAGLAPAWADEVRHPDMNSTEYRRRIGTVYSADFHEEVAVGVVQNGSGAPVQISIGGVRFTPQEAQDYRTTIGLALDVAGGADGTSLATLQPPPGDPGEPSAASCHAAALPS
jgi:hypothetical protein